MLATAPTLVLSFHGSSVERCKHLNLAHQITLLFSQVFIALLLITRTYALYYRNRLIIVPTVLIGVPVTVAILFLFARDHKSGIPFPEGCILLTSQKTGRRIALAYLLSLLFNTAVFTLTVVRPWLPGLRESANNQRKKEIPLVTVMVRDGVFYFFVIIIANLINIANFFRGGPISKGLGATFASNMSSTMMSRLMLNIREQSVLLSRGTVATSTVYESYLTTGLEFTMPVHSVGVETFGEDYELENI
ncbi:hypothetical protein BD410DRAFT_896715 [Rickenella mellea]|uniref:Uncharacterized protein n=1 Tax=Rickenella mellea TaxID=50990 RepID=A0A4Y7QBR2_9AGAM|nr:hypothetical protein BD410DRAFT_896715 [Rickenella mellea]